jgi:cathepsin L
MVYITAVAALMSMCPIIFQEFTMTYNKVYKSQDEYDQRQSIFCSNYQFIEQHNSRNGVNFKLDVNEFADLTDKEFEYLYTNKVDHHDMLDNSIDMDTKVYDSEIPESVDWVVKGHVSPVKNQGQCGSCWSFSATGVIESHLSIFKNKSVLLSEQELVDCSWLYGNLGCGGGMPSRAFKYVKKFGLSTEEEYPYDAKNHMCKTITRHYDEKYKIGGWNSVESFNETRLVEVLANVGPISVALDASSKEFRFYKSGVMDTCGIQLNHAVLLVGYGVEDGQDYFKIKNSWGETYGDEGYLKVSRNKHYMGTCGLASLPVYPTGV